MDGLHYDLEREAVRVVLTDAGGRVLLFHVETEDVPGGQWELPGGGIDPGESYLEAAIREIREETGLVLDSAQVHPIARLLFPGRTNAEAFGKAQRWVNAHKVFLVDVSWDYLSDEPKPFVLSIYFVFEDESGPESAAGR